MLTPKQYDIIAESLTGLFQDLEDFVIRDFVRRVVTAGTITETAKWQEIRAREMGLSTDAIRKAVKQALKMSGTELDDLFEKWGTESLKAENTILKELGKKPVNIGDHEELQQILHAVLNQTKGEVKNITQSLGFAKKVGGKTVFMPMAEFYQKELDFVQLQVQTGMLDYNSAVRQSVKRMADSGLRTVDYASGWSNHLDVAIRRATLTGANQLSGQMTDVLGEEMGCNYVEVTAHSGARNTGSGSANHKGWQGKVYCRKGQTKAYPNLSKATGFGTGEGLKGWNCRHDYNNFWPGISTRAWSDEALKNIDPKPFTYKGKIYDHYQANQRQREIERAIRRSKREIIGHQTSGDEEAFITSSIKLQRQRQEYQGFSKAADLRMKPERQQVYNFDKSISQKAVRVAKKQRTNAIKDDIIKAGAISGALTSKNDPNFVKRNQFAEQFYTAVKNSKKEPFVKNISKNLKTSENNIEKVYDHIFINKYKLAKGYSNFDPDFDMAQSLIRLRDGKEIQNHDIVLIKHERLEYELMTRYGKSYDEAHYLAEKKHNYKKELINYLKENELG